MPKFLCCLPGAKTGGALGRCNEGARPPLDCWLTGCAVAHTIAPRRGAVSVCAVFFTPRNEARPSRDAAQAYSKCIETAARQCNSDGGLPAYLDLRA